MLLPLRTRLGFAAWLAVAIGLLAGCGGASPQVHVIGVAPASDRAHATSDDRLVVFLEVVNRTGRELELSRFEYRLSAAAWFDAQGQLALRRHIDADSSVVVEVPVDLARSRVAELVDDNDVDYQLEGRIVAREDRVERSWTVSTSGRLRATEGGVTRGLVRVRVAASD
jgi:hypothetical protein